jgi:hypothetical protein
LLQNNSEQAALASNVVMSATHIGAATGRVALHEPVKKSRLFSMLGSVSRMGIKVDQEPQHSAGHVGCSRGVISLQEDRKRAKQLP